MLTSAYLGVPRLVTFALTTALCVCSCSCAAWAVAHAYDLKHFVRQRLPGAELDVHNALASGGAFVAIAALTALLCFLMAIAMIFRRRQPETIKSVRVKEGIFAFMLVALLATLIPATYICATGSGVVRAPAIPASTLQTIIAISGLSLAYSDQISIRVYIILGWLAFASTAVNLILVSLEARHVLKNGPSDGLLGGAEKPLTAEKPAHQV